MRIVSFQVENFRNIRLAECDSVPQFMVICGGNGCGKSALLEALMTAKEHAGSYGNFSFDRSIVSADASVARIAMRVAFSDEERLFVQQTFDEVCPVVDDVEIEVKKGGGAKTRQSSQAVRRLFSYYSRALGSPGFFDYITAYRQTTKTTLNSWDASFLSDDRAKQTLAQSIQKFQFTKQYLAGLKMHDLQSIQTAQREGKSWEHDSLAPIRDTFNRFFYPMRLDDVYLNRSPFQFVVDTPRGPIDIDDLSSGEKEILNVFIRFHQLNPNGAVVLFDEADAHLHPDLERRYFEELRRLARENQMILTTHSPEMMIAAGCESLFTILKHPVEDKPNQLAPVSARAELHEALAELLGSRGIVSFNQRIVFIEGTEASADKAIYEALYPPAAHNISFVPAGNSALIRRTAEQVNMLLSASIGFQGYFSIVDQDIDRSEDDPTGGRRLFRLPVYHVENFLLDSPRLLEVLQEFLGARCPYGDVAAFELDLRGLVLEEQHMKPYTRALLDAKLARCANSARDAVFARESPASEVLPTFAEVENEARTVLEKALDDGSWTRVVKARELLKALCARHGLNYEHFRNAVIAKLGDPPEELEDIISRIKAAL